MFFTHHIQKGTVLSLHCLLFIFIHNRYPQLGTQLAHLCGKAGCIADTREASWEDNESMKQCIWVVTSKADPASLDPRQLQADLICQHPIPCIPSTVRISRRLMDLNWTQAFDRLAFTLAADEIDLNRNLLSTSLPNPAPFMLNHPDRKRVSYWCPLCGKLCGNFVKMRTHVARHSQKGTSYYTTKM